MSTLNTLSSKPTIWLGGSLASHRRGRILKTTVDAQPSDILPPGQGICLLFGTDFQQAAEIDSPRERLRQRQEWINWSQAPGRVLLLIPPFKSGECALPKDWEALRRTIPPSTKQNEFLASLAPEVQYELKGQLQIAQNLGSTWDDGSLCTIYYRKHPHSGIFAVTCLPLWSLVVLDRAPALQQWLNELFELTGNFSAANELLPPTAAFLPSTNHFTLLLHLLTASFNSETEALAALQHSQIFSIEPIEAERCLGELQTHDLVTTAQLTPAGREILIRSHYAPYAEALEALTLTSVLENKSLETEVSAGDTKSAFAD
jgi:hypothetical protein